MSVGTPPWRRETICSPIAFVKVYVSFQPRRLAHRIPSTSMRPSTHARRRLSTVVVPFWPPSSARPLAFSNSLWRAGLNDSASTSSISATMAFASSSTSYGPPSSVMSLFGSIGSSGTTPCLVPLT